MAVGRIRVAAEVRTIPNLKWLLAPQRRASFVVLALGVIWLGYLVVKFIRSPTTFR